MKILHLITSLAGGPSKIMSSIIRKKENKESHSILVLSDLNIDKEVYSQLIKNNIKINFVQRRFLFDYKPYFKLLKLTENSTPDLILSYDNYSNFIGFLRVFKISKIKLICSVHGLKGAFKWWKIPIQIIIYKFAKFIIVPSKNVRKKILRHKIVNQNKIKVIHNGIDLNFLINNKKKIGNNLKIVCVANFYSKFKGQKYLIESLKYLPSKFSIYLIGDGILIDDIKKISIENNLDRRVKFLGFKNENFLKKNLCKFDLMVIPSLSESFCIAALEGMASGLPVIASDVGGLGEIFENRQNGILVNPGKPDLIAKEVIKISNDFKKYQLIRKNALLTVKKKYSEKIMVKNYKYLFKML